MRKTFLNIIEVAIPISILLLWAWLTRSDNSFVFPSFADVLIRFRELWMFDRIESDVIPSLTRLFQGYFVSIAIGVAVGIPIGISPIARRAFSPLIEFFRAMPSPALIPFAITIFGVGDSMKVFIIAFVCVWPVLLNTIDGVRGLDPLMKDVAASYRIGKYHQLRYIVFPNALPQIMAGMRISLALALILMVISEMVASSEGIGYFILQSQRSFSIKDMWAGIVLLGLIGYLLNLAFSVIERRMLSWHIELKKQ